MCVCVCVYVCVCVCECVCVSYWLVILSRVSVKDSNFPHEFVQVFTGLAVDIARRCVEPPIMKKKG